MALTKVLAKVKGTSVIKNVVILRERVILGLVDCSGLGISYFSLAVAFFSSQKVHVAKLYRVKYFVKKGSKTDEMQVLFQCRANNCKAKICLLVFFHPNCFFSVAVTGFLRLFQNDLKILRASMTNHFIANRSNFNCCNLITVFH